jgi:hypothetical protein
MTNLFYDNDLSEKIGIVADDINCEIYFKDGAFIGCGKGKEVRFFEFSADYNEIIGFSHFITSPFKFYRFRVINQFLRQEVDFLLPPKGENLLQLLLTNKNLKKLIADIFSEFGLRIVLKPQERKIETQKEIEDVIISYPYSLVSDTLQRVIFHLAAVEINKDSIIIFEEPEAHAFPYYTKFLAERVALDKTNQYFISTHNPYFLFSTLEKTPQENIGIFITYFKDYQTKVRPLTKEEMPEILNLDASVFFNLDKFLGKE